MNGILEAAEQARKNVADAIEHSQDPQVKRALAALKKVVGDEIAKETLMRLVPELTGFAGEMEMNEKMMCGFAADQLKQVRHDVLEMSKQFVFQCETEQDGEKAYRTLSVPAAYSWAAFAYHVLAAFGYEGGLRFWIEHDEDVFGPLDGCLGDEFVMNGNEVPLFEDNLRKGSRAELSFGETDDVHIECRIIRTINAKTMAFDKAAELLNGSGNGPFERSFDLEARKKDLGQKAADLYETHRKEIETMKEEWIEDLDYDPDIDYLDDEYWDEGWNELSNEEIQDEIKKHLEHLQKRMDKK